MCVWGQGIRTTFGSQASLLPCGVGGVNSNLWAILLAFQNLKENSLTNLIGMYIFTRWSYIFWFAFFLILILTQSNVQRRKQNNLIQKWLHLSFSIYFLICVFVFAQFIGHSLVLLLLLKLIWLPKHIYILGFLYFGFFFPKLFLFLSIKHDITSRTTPIISCLYFVWIIMFKEIYDETPLPDNLYSHACYKYNYMFKIFRFLGEERWLSG